MVHLETLVVDSQSCLLPQAFYYHYRIQAYCQLLSRKNIALFHPSMFRCGWDMIVMLLTCMSQVIPHISDIEVMKKFMSDDVDRSMMIMITMITK